jgi:hypothetical protein
MTALPVGERVGKNCLTKWMVELTLVRRVFLAVSYEGISEPKSAPKAALATTQSN